MLVSRKNLTLIHLVPCKAPPSLHMLQPSHKRVVFLNAAGARGELRKPFAKGGIEGFMLGFSDKAGLFNQVLVSAEGDVLHTNAVYTVFVQFANELMPRWL
jgi:hypothetical protein